MERIKRYFIALSITGVLVVFSATNLIYAQNFSSTVTSVSSSDVLGQDSHTSSPSITEPLLLPIPDGGVLPANLTDTQRVYSSESSTYTLGKEDIIEIDVLRHPEVSGLFEINNEGKIQYEFIGDVYVEGMTKDEVKEVIVDQLSTYVISPDVTVKIAGYNSKIVYVIGEVGRPGKIFMRGDTISVREALVQAGLPLLTAKTTKGSLITPTDDGHPGLKNVNVHKLLIKGDLRENLVMNPGDTLYLPPTLMAKTMRVLKPVTDPIGTSAGTARTVTTGF
jgi:polysaccharide biosynthesis/export protein